MINNKQFFSTQKASPDRHTPHTLLDKKWKPFTEIWEMNLCNQKEAVAVFFSFSA